MKVCKGAEQYAAVIPLDFQCKHDWWPVGEDDYRWGGIDWCHKCGALRLNGDSKKGRIVVPTEALPDKDCFAHDDPDKAIRSLY